MTVVAETTNFNAASGNLYECTGTITATLPALVAGAIFGFLVVSGTLTISTVAAGGLITGQGISATTVPIAAGAGTVVVLIDDGTNRLLEIQPANVGSFPSIGVGATNSGTAGTLYGPSGGFFLKSGALIAAQMFGASFSTNQNTPDDGSGNSNIIGSLGIGPSNTHPSVAGTIATAPPSSHTVIAALGQLTFGTAYQNTLSYDVWVTVTYQRITSAAGTITAGVGSTSTPTADTAEGSLASLNGDNSLTYKVPAGYYLLLATTGSVAVSVVTTTATA